MLIEKFVKLLGSLIKGFSEGPDFCMPIIHEEVISHPLPLLIGVNLGGPHRISHKKFCENVPNRIIALQYI